MATGKPKSGAGPYAGYKKNYSPIKSSKGTKAEKVVGKVLAAAGGGVKPQKVKVAGRTMTTKPTEAGLGVVGAMAKAVARTTARNAGKDAAKATTKRPNTVSITKWNYKSKETPKRRIGSIGKEYAKQTAKSDKRSRTEVKEWSKERNNLPALAPKFKQVSPTSPQWSKVGVKPYSKNNEMMSGKVPVKGRTSRPKGKK
jgi:hypothetical protein